ncbi:MAG: ABC transporter permease [Acidimicrobiales bacterium]
MSDVGIASNLRRLLAIAVVELRRLFRERWNIFFVLVFPMLLVFVLGLVFGGGFDSVLGVVAPADDALADDLVASIDETDQVDVQRYDSTDELRTAVERGSVRAGVVLPEEYTAQLSAGGTAQLGFLTRPDGLGSELRSVVEAAVGDQTVALQAAQFDVAQTGASFDRSLAAAREAEQSTEPVSVRTMTVGEELFPEELGQFGQGATSQLVLFMFVTGLAGSSALILTRQLGVARRMFSTPSSSAVVLGGEAVGRFAVVAFQGTYIMLGTWLVFDVDWGDPLGVVVLMLVFGAVATGAAMLAGALFRNEQQAGGVGVVFGLGLAALGGCMAPLEIFSPTMRTIAHITPHAWALDGFSELVNHDSTVLDILPELGVLTAMATVLLVLGTRQFRRAIIRS